MPGCTLLTQADAQAVLGGAVDSPNEKSQDQKDGSWTASCNYYSSGTSRGAGLLARYTPKTEATKALTGYVDGLKKSLGDAYKPEMVPGVGEGAVWDASTKQLTVFKGSYMLILSLTGSKLEASAALEGATTLAGKVLANLPK